MDKRNELISEGIRKCFAEGDSKMANRICYGYKQDELLHDIDYEQYPDQHCSKARDILLNHCFPEDYIHAVQSHGYAVVNDIQPVHRMEKVLYTIDELTGLIAAVALMRPSKSILDLGISSVKKKWKQKDFAAGVNRKVIEEGTKMLDMDLEEVIQHTIEGMKMIHTPSWF